MERASAQQIADQYGFTARHWTRMAHDGKIPGVFQPGGPRGRLVFDMKVFRRWAHREGYGCIIQPSPPEPYSPVKKPKRLPQLSDSVYLAECGGKVKIGVSNNVTKRLHGFKTASPLPVTLLAKMPGSVDLEGELHRRFASAHSHGEWFHLTPEIQAYIDEVNRGSG